MIRTLSENVVVPIAGMIISFVLIYELITMVIDKNNMHDFDTSRRGRKRRQEKQRSRRLKRRKTVRSLWRGSYRSSQGEMRACL